MIPRPLLVTLVISGVGTIADGGEKNYVDWENTAYVHVLASDGCGSGCPPSEWPGDILGPRAQMGGTPASFSYDYTCCDKSAGIKALISSGAPTSIFAGIYSAYSTGGSARFEHEVDMVVGTMAGS